MCVQQIAREKPVASRIVYKTRSIELEPVTAKHILN